MKLQEISKAKAAKREAKEKELSKSIKKLEEAKAKKLSKKQKEKEAIAEIITKSKANAKAEQKKQAEKVQELPKKEEVLKVDEKEEAKERVEAPRRNWQHYKARLKALSKDELLSILKTHKVSVESDKKADLVEAVYQIEIKL